jgi:hypothetical protein
MPRAKRDAGVLPNGNILLFDNYGHYGSGGESKAIKFSPTTSKMIWTYAGDEHEYFGSGSTSGQQRLPNGNTRITDADGGRLLEVTPSGETVWQHMNPVRRGQKHQLMPVLLHGTRIALAALDREFLRSIDESKASLQAMAGNR